MDPRGITAARAKWGRVLPHQRANVDQVPLPCFNDMEETPRTNTQLSDTVCSSQFLRVWWRASRGFLKWEVFFMPLYAQSPPPSFPLPCAAAELL